MPVAAQPGHLNRFQKALIGTWSNRPLPGPIDTQSRGGPENPFSYNVMPLPQSSDTTSGYILKNFKYYETVQFESKNDVAIPATAPNRGADSLQLPTALFYNQHVFFADGPGKGKTVHVENGAWLNLQLAKKLVGPYPPPPGSFLEPSETDQLQSTITLAKQMSVPHGNSILALGSFTEPTAGAPSIPDAPPVLPTPSGLDTDPYKTQLDQEDDYQNPFPDLTANTNKPLQEAVGLIDPNHYIKWQVSTENQGHAINIPFEESAADVTKYTASYWLLSTDGGDSYTYLAYTQSIWMTFVIGGTQYSFPHVTSNVVTRD